MPVQSLNTVEKYKSLVIYDIANNIRGIDLNTSLEVATPDMLFVEGLGAGTTVSVQVRPSASTIWYELQLIDGATTSDAIVYTDKRFNFVRTVKVGASPVRVIVQQ